MKVYGSGTHATHAAHKTLSLKFISVCSQVDSIPRLLADSNANPLFGNISSCQPWKLPQIMNMSSHTQKMRQLEYEVAETTDNKIRAAKVLSVRLGTKQKIRLKYLKIQMIINRRKQ